MSSCRVLFLIFTSMLLAMLTDAARAAVDDSASRMLLHHGGLASEAVALSGRVEIRVTAMLARTTVTQVFENRSGEWAEGRYLFPLPEHSSVDELRIRIGDRRIQGEIREKQDARRVLAEARAGGRSAGLVEQHKAQLYSTTVTNIGPGEHVEVTIGFSHRVEYRTDGGRGVFRLVFPTTQMPRYGNGQERNSALDVATTVRPALAPAPEVRVSHAVRRPLELEVTLAPGFEITPPASLHHPVRMSRAGGDLKLELADAEGARGRDFELEWSPARPDRLEAALMVEEMHGKAHALLMLVPPADFRPRRLHRDLILVIDQSGSMQGGAFEQAREALRLALDRMRPEDRFNVIAFNQDATALFQRPREASRANLVQAYGFLEGLSAGGGTEMDQALHRALESDAASDRLPQVVFVTDGSIGNETQVLDLVRRRIGSARLFTVGIGHGVNAAFLGQLARAGRGTLTRIPDPARIAERTETLLRQLEAPVLTDIQVDWPMAAEVWPDPLPDLYAGEPLILTARLDVPVSHLRSGQVRATGFRDLQFLEMEWPLTRFHEAPGVARAWARARIDGLGALLPGEMDEQLRQDERLLTALDYRIISDQTSLIAVDQTPRRSREAVLARHQITGEAPADRDPAAVMAMPATDGGTLEMLLRGISVLTIVLLMLFHRRMNRVEQIPETIDCDPEPPR